MPVVIWAALHILLAAVGMASVTAAPRGIAGEAALGYIDIAGLYNEFSFFAPQVPDPHLLQIETHMKDGSTLRYASGESHDENEIRLQTLLSAFSDAKTPTLEAALLGRYILSARPDCKEVDIHILLRKLPTMAEYAEGKRGQLINVGDYHISEK